MAAYFGFLRAINLGPTRKFSKADISRVVTDAGFDDAETHINTGNVRFTTSMRSLARIEQTLERAFLADRGFEVPTIAFRPTEFAGIATDAAELAAAHPRAIRHYVSLMRSAPQPAVAADIEATSTEAGSVYVRGRAVHALLVPGYEDADVPALRAAKLLGVSTTRNATVVAAIAAKWC
ncbi:DUF1697 domain-containing protein [Microbacterium sp. NPDC055910]|uniref:DUF1697 domain-containing protein n=1 Tax=Microbacterium sp. NPDC055910 TaxID=3345659 RepID=UPI0035E30091